MVEHHGLSERRACGLCSLHRSTKRYRHRRDPDTVLRERLRALAAAYPRYGYRRLWVLLRREGHRVNRKRVQRLYRQENLAVRRKRRKRLANTHRQPLTCPIQPNVHWAMDFTSDQLSDRRRFRTFNVVDVFTRECLDIDVATSLPAARIIRTLDRIVDLRGAPQRITVDNGPEFISRAMDAWAYRHGITLDFIQPGKPMQNGFIESFNGSFRDECLDRHWFLSLEDARRVIEAYRVEYNTIRPHSSLGNLTPAEFAALNSPGADQLSEAVDGGRHRSGGLEGAASARCAGADYAACRPPRQLDDPTCLPPTAKAEADHQPQPVLS